MASWGRYNTQTHNPFAQGDDDIREDSVSSTRDQSSNRFGAWGSRLQGPDDGSDQQAYTPAPYPPSTAATSANKKSFFSRFGTGSSPEPQLPTSQSAWSPGASTLNQTPLQQRELDLLAREEELRRREQQLRDAGVKKKNWPPCRPILYHNIHEEVPQWNRGMVRFGYLAWNLQAAGFLLNWVAVLIFMFSSTGMKTSSFFICTIATVIGLPASFFLWYRSLYFAAQTDGAVYAYTKTFVFMLIQLVWSGLVIISPPVVGYFNAGILEMISRFNASGGKSVFFGILCIINIALWSVGATFIWFAMAKAVQAMRAGDIPRKLWMQRLGMSTRV